MQCAGQSQALGVRVVGTGGVSGQRQEGGCLDLHALHVGLCKLGLGRVASQPQLVAVGAVAHKPDLAHVRPCAAVGASCDADRWSLLRQPAGSAPSMTWRAACAHWECTACRPWSFSPAGFAHTCTLCLACFGMHASRASLLSRTQPAAEPDQQAVPEGMVDWPGDGVT